TLRFCITPVLFFFWMHLAPTSTLFPYTTLFRSFEPRVQALVQPERVLVRGEHRGVVGLDLPQLIGAGGADQRPEHDFDPVQQLRSEEHTSELQSRFDIVCRLLLEKKK